MTSEIMHYNMAIQRALIFMYPSYSVLAASYLLDRTKVMNGFLVYSCVK